MKPQLVCEYGPMGEVYYRAKYWLSAGSMWLGPSRRTAEEALAETPEETPSGENDPDTL